MKNDIEFKQMLGIREQNDDGFTYSYGGRIAKYGCGACRRQRKNIVPRMKRNDKRSIKQAAMKRIFSEAFSN